MHWIWWVLIVIGGIIGLLLFGLIALGIGISRAQKRTAPDNLEAAEAAFEAGDIRGALQLLAEAYYVPFSDNYDEVTARTNLGAVRLLELILDERRRQQLDTPNLETAGLQNMLERCANGGGRVPNHMAHDVENFLGTAADTMAFDASHARTRRRGRRRQTFTEPNTNEPATTDPRSHEELEAAIVADPDDEAAFLVYSDWLQTRNDPRGMLITLQHRADSNPADVAARTEERAWFERHQNEFMGELLGRDGLELSWQLGFIRTARITRPSLSSGHDGEWLVQHLLGHPSARFLHTLHIGLLNHEHDWAPGIRLMIEAGSKPSLRKLHLGDFQYPEECEMSWASITGAGDLWPLLPNLETLVLQAGELDFGQLELPRLESLHVRTGGLDVHSLRAVTRREWPRLRRLHVWTGSQEFGGEADIADLAPILKATNFRRLEELGIMNSELADAVCRALPTSNVLPQLKVLNLSMGTMSDQGLDAIIEHIDAFSHLDELVLNDNYLSSEKIAMLLDARPAGAPQVVAHNQLAPTEHRYVTVGE